MAFRMWLLSWEEFLVLETLIGAMSALDFLSFRLPFLNLVLLSLILLIIGLHIVRSLMVCMGLITRSVLFRHLILMRHHLNFELGLQDLLKSIRILANVEFDRGDVSLRNEVELSLHELCSWLIPVHNSEQTKMPAIVRLARLKLDKAIDRAEDNLGAQRTWESKDS